jgi:hypothetical protein
MIINYYKNVKSPSVQYNIELNDWLTKIKAGEFKEKINSLRLLDKSSPDFNSLKLSLPCVTYNFFYNSYKKDENIASSTGYIFIDIDNLKFSLSKSIQHKVHAYYKSVSNNGVHLIVKASNIPKDISNDDFSNFYRSIVNDLGISDIVDISAVKRSQFSIVSYDEDLYLNNNSIVYEYVNTPLKVTNFNTIIKEEKKSISHLRGGIIKYTNLYDIVDIDSGYSVFKDGIYETKSYLTGKVKRGNRQNFFSSYCNNLICINEGITKAEVYNVLSNINNHHCVEPLPKADLIKIINYKFKNIDKLIPIKFKKPRKIVFAKVSEYSTKEKRQIVAKVVGSFRTENKLKELEEIILNWDNEKYGKVSQSKIYSNFKISKNFVEKHYNKFKNN